MSIWQRLDSCSCSRAGCPDVFEFVFDQEHLIKLYETNIRTPSKSLRNNTMFDVGDIFTFFYVFCVIALTHQPFISTTASSVLFPTQFQVQRQTSETYSVFGQHLRFVFPLLGWWPSFLKLFPNIVLHFFLKTIKFLLYNF